MNFDSFHLGQFSKCNLWVYTFFLSMCVYECVCGGQLYVCLISIHTICNVYLCCILALPSVVLSPLFYLLFSFILSPLIHCMWTAHSLLHWLVPHEGLLFYIITLADAAIRVTWIIWAVSDPQRKRQAHHYR